MARLLGFIADSRARCPIASSRCNFQKMHTQINRCIVEDDKRKVDELPARKMSLRLMFAVGFCSRSTSRMASSRYSSTTPASSSVSLSLLIFLHSVPLDCSSFSLLLFLVT
jgi:hypothetical protein